MVESRSPSCEASRRAYAATSSAPAYALLSRIRGLTRVIDRCDPGSARRLPCSIIGSAELDLMRGAIRCLPVDRYANVTVRLGDSVDSGQRCLSFLVDAQLRNESPRADVAVVFLHSVMSST